MRSEVTISLSTSRFGYLLDAVTIAQWVVCAGEAFQNQGYRHAIDEIQQSLLRVWKEFGFAKDVVEDEEGEGLSLRSFEDGEGDAWQAVEDHDEETFWEGMVCRLAPIIAMREVGAERWSQRTEMENHQSIQFHESRIRDTLDRHGLHGMLLIPANEAG